jgi:hypothetical protein
MKRRKSDPRVREVLRHFDHEVRRTDDDPDSSGSIDGWMSLVVDTRVDFFDMPTRWPIDAVREVLVAILVNTPDRDLDDILARAREEAASGHYATDGIIGKAESAVRDGRRKPTKETEVASAEAH